MVPVWSQFRNVCKLSSFDQSVRNLSFRRDKGISFVNNDWVFLPTLLLSGKGLVLFVRLSKMGLFYEANKVPQIF